MKCLSYFLVILSLASQSRAAFEENGRRYLSGPEVLWSLQTLFGYQGKSRCLLDSEATLLDLGASHPVSGQPSSPTPSQAAIDRIASCLKTLMDTIGQQEPLRSQGQINSFLTGLSKDEMTRHQLNSESASLQATPWKALPSSVQKAIIEKQVQRVLGSDDRIKDYNLIQNPEDLRQHLFHYLNQNSQDGKNLRQTLYTLLLGLVLRDEFLSY